MSQEHDAEVSDVNTSRRCVLALFAGTVTTGLSNWIRDEHHQDISHSQNRNGPMKQEGHMTSRQSTGGERLAYVTLPGLSTASLLANLPYLMNGSSRLRPVILMDIHDYNRLQAVALTETDSPWNQSLAMAHGHLFRRGVVQLIDYSEFYMNHTQQKILTQNREALEKVTDDVQRRAAMEAAQGRITYQRGEYQESFRDNLGEDLDTFIGGRRTEEHRHQKLKRGCANPLTWNERIYNQYAAALEVREGADEVFDHLNVKYVIGEGESALFGRDGLVEETSHIPDQSHIEKLPPEELAYTREIFETIGELAVEMTGVQHDDWMLLAPTLAIPQYDDVFNISVIQNETESGFDRMNLANEVVDVVTLLQNRAEDSPDPTSLVEWLMESEIMPFSAGQAERQRLTKMTNYATTLAQYSKKLRDLDNVSQTAALIGATIVSDPSPRDEFDTVYQQGYDLIKRLNPPSVDAKQHTVIRRRLQGWDETSDWYEKTDRTR